jgi:type II secretory pathway component GspD/PulD (secretin)
MNYSEEPAPVEEKTIPEAVVETPETPAKPVEAEPLNSLGDLDSWEDQNTDSYGSEEVISLSDLDSLVEESDEQISGGDFANAQRGFAKVIKGAPEDSTMYMRTLLERDHRSAETNAMDTVDAAWTTDMILRSYTLNSGASERMQLEDVTSAVDVETLFPQVDFPEKSSAIYQPETDAIFVYNTPANLAVLETMLNTMGVLRGAEDAEQVEIEAKFVEVSEGTLEELGFQWNFDDPTHVGIGGTDMNVSDGSGGLFAESLRGNPNNSSGGSLPFDRPSELGDGTLAADGNWSTFNFEDTFSSVPSEMRLEYTGNNAFELLISALDQSSGADVLSAPRVLTRSGEKAMIRVGELHYFPEVFEGDSSQATILNISYEDFEEKLLGVELTVIPKVREEREITLQLNPRISELAGWQNYQLAPANSIYNHRQRDLNRRYIHPAITASLPVFNKREIETEVTIADGSTIGMGGLINEKIEAFEDKVPVLGSIPLVGRLFRNEGERAVKRNLLMFVTAKIIEPNGRVDTSRSFE